MTNETTKAMQIVSVCLLLCQKQLVISTRSVCVKNIFSVNKISGTEEADSF